MTIHDSSTEDHTPSDDTLVVAAAAIATADVVAVETDIPQNSAAAIATADVVAVERDIPQNSAPPPSLPPTKVTKIWMITFVFPIFMAICFYNSSVVFTTTNKYFSALLHDVVLIEQHVLSTPPTTYFLVRILFLRSLAFVYCVSFIIAYKQNKALIGDNGITPARIILDQSQSQWNDTMRKKGRKNPSTQQQVQPLCNKNKCLDFLLFYYSVLVDTIRTTCLWDRRDPQNKDRIVTTILWLAHDRSKLNPWLDGIALCGIIVSILVFLLGDSTNALLLVILFICHRSLWAVGGEWYEYGWEYILSEVGFYAIWIGVPWFHIHMNTTTTANQGNVPLVVIWAIRWLLFRIMLGAGLIKLRGGSQQCWYDLTAMDYFYETQPIPSALSRYFHFAPSWWHRMEVLGNHVVELVVPWFLLLPATTMITTTPQHLFRYCRIVGGSIQIMFQGVLILSGNLSYLNWLTAIPALFCLDDEFLKQWIPLLASYKNENDDGNGSHHNNTGKEQEDGLLFQQFANGLFGITIIILSVPAIQNLLCMTKEDHKQIMIGSFDPYQIITCFAAFGSVSKERIELIISSSLDGKEWKEYEFPVKPGRTDRYPHWVSPYHYRLDWQMWIASQLQTISSSPWMYKFLLKLLEADEEVLNTLVLNNPWGRQKPKFIRIEKYKYKFVRGSSNKECWSREYVGKYYPSHHGNTNGATIEKVRRHVDMFG